MVEPLDVDTLVTTLSDHIEIEDDDGNIYTFGNDLLTGGKGSDVFSFTLLEAGGELVMPGNDQITDFSLKHDTLEFIDVIDVDNSGMVDIDDLDAVTDVSLVGDDLIIQFDVGGADAGSVALLDFETNNPGAPIPTSIVDLAAVVDIVEAV